MNSTVYCLARGRARSRRCVRACRGGPLARPREGRVAPCRLIEWCNALQLRVGGGAALDRSLSAYTRAGADARRWSGATAVPLVLGSQSRLPCHRLHRTHSAQSRSCALVIHVGVGREAILLQLFDLVGRSRAALQRSTTGCTLAGCSRRPRVTSTAESRTASTLSWPWK